jgi:hypothetical protein
MAVPVVRVEHRRMRLGAVAERDRLGGAGAPADLVQLVEGGRGALATQRLLEHRVAGRVVAGERRHLVGDLVG